MIFGTADDTVDEDLELENRYLQEDLTDIFMDLGPITRELAPLKLKPAKGTKVKSKTVRKYKIPIDVPGIEIDMDLQLFGHHMFHHILGLSNMSKALRPIVDELNLQELTSDEDDEDFIKETSYDRSLIKNDKHNNINN